MPEMAIVTVRSDRSQAQPFVLSPPRKLLAVAELQIIIIFFVKQERESSEKKLRFGCGSNKAKLLQL